MSSTHRKNLLAFCIAAAISPQVFAEQQSVLEEVTVTAQKREQSMQDVSVAVSAFSGDAIEKMGFEEGLDITQQVPNMNFFAIFGEASSPSVSLRGISLVNFSDSWESPVSIYVDDVYRGNPAGSAIQLFDLERVEVLRGPQGTLYGRNTTGGLVHYVSRKPTDEFEASASASFGSYSERIVEGMVSGAISDGVRGRIAVKNTVNDGWQTNIVTGEKLNDTDSFGYRTQLEFDLADSGSLLLNVHGSKADQGSVGFAHMGYKEAPDPNAATCSVSKIQSGKCYASSSFNGMSGEDAVNGKYDPEHVASGAADGLGTQIDTFGSSATLSWDFENFSLTSITAYEELDKFLQDDGDGTAVIYFDEQYSVDAEQYTQEIRLNGSTDSYNWVTGFYYYKDDRGLATEAPTTADWAEQGLWHREIVTLDSTSWALFGQVEYDLHPELTLVSGLRYTEEDRDFSQDVGPSFYTEAVDVPHHNLSDSATTGRIGLDWRPDEATLTYASFSTGFKSGGYSGSYNRNLETTLPVDAETITNFELGVKTTLADRFRVNAAAFRYTVEDFQAQRFISVEGGSEIINAGDVTGTGAEIEITAPIGDNFELIGGAGWLNTNFDSELNFGVAGTDYPLDGNELPSAPGLTWNMVARYYLGLGDAGDLVFQGDYSWQDDHYLQVENDPYSHHDAYGLANASISWNSADGRYTVVGFVDNLADEEYFTYQNTLGNDNHWGYGVWGQPRTAGLRLNWQL